MAWIELHTVLIKHRKIKKLARKLDIKPVVAVGHLTTFWGNVLELAESGDITKWDAQDIAEYACWEGDAGLFYEAMVNDGDGFIEERDGKRFVHDWFEYAGRYLKAKYHTYNPEKLKEIMANYAKATFRQPLGDLKATNLPIIPTNSVDKPKGDLKVTYSVKDILPKYLCLYENHYKTKYIVTGKDAGILKNLLRQMDAPAISALFDKFFASNDAFIVNSGHSLAVFASQINKLSQQKEVKGAWGDKL